MKSLKLQKVEEFMGQALASMSDAGVSHTALRLQRMPQAPTQPEGDVRALRARLIFEECLETIRALGVSIYPDNINIDLSAIKINNLSFESDKEFDIFEVADGLADIEVVTLGTYAACGLDDVEIFNEVHESNMEKFPKGYNGLQPDGKWKKPDDHKGPDLKSVILVDTNLKKVE